MRFAQQAKKIGTSIHYQFGVAESERFMGDVYNMKGQYSKASNQYFAAMKRFEHIDSPEAKAEAILMRIVCKSWLGVSELPFNKATDTLRFAIKSLKNSRNTLLKADITNRLAHLYWCTDSTSHCKEIFKQSIYYYKQAQEWYKKANYVDGIEGSKVNLACGYIAIGNYQLAKSLLLDASKQLERLGNIAGYGVAIGNLATIYVQEKNIDKALSIALDNFKRTRYYHWAVGYTGGCTGLMELYEKKGDYKNAYKYALLRQRLQDSLVTAEQFEQINNLQHKYEIQRKVEKIKKLDLENKFNVSQLDNQKLKTIALFITLLLMAAIFIVFFIFYKNKQQIKELKALLKGQEDERSRISAELHDGLGGLLATLKTQTSLMHHDGQDHQVNPQVFMHVNQLIDQACEEVREVSHSLSPLILTKFGLESALKNIILKINYSGIATFKLDYLLAAESLSHEKELHIYRILLELIQNIIKHAKAKSALVQVIEHPTEIILLVEDDGVGFNANENKVGLGLKNIKNRLLIIKGKMKIDTQENRGTSIIISIEK